MVGLTVVFGWCLFIGVVYYWRRAAGRVSPRRARYFSCTAKKSTQKKAAPLTASLRFAAGNLWCSGMGCTAKLTTRQRRSVQTDAVSQFTKQLHSAVQLPSPYPVLLGAFRRGLSRRGPSLRSAPKQAERSDGLLVFGCCLHPPFACAWVVVFVGWRWRRRVPALRELACRVCSNGALSARSEFRGTPRKRHDTGCPSQSEGSQAAGATFFWVLFLVAKKSTSPAGRNPASSPTPVANSAHD